MAATGSDITELVEAYRTARLRISQLEPALERELGLASLRLEVLAGYRHLTTTSPGLTAEVVAPLTDYVANLVGGEGIEAGLDALDRKAGEVAKKVAGEVSSALITGKIVGFTALTAGGAALIAALEGAGALLFTVATTGGAATIYFYRALFAAASASSEWRQRASRLGWAWSTSLGKQADAVLDDAMTTQDGVLRRVAGGPANRARITGPARWRAVAVTAFAWAAGIAGVAIIVIGFASALGDRLDTFQEPSGLPTGPFTSTLFDVNPPPPVLTLNDGQEVTLDFK
jgi:hypothetical protein